LWSFDAFSGMDLPCASIYNLTAIGISSKIALQVLLNIAVVTNSIPNTGISLPFFSYLYII